MFTIYGSQTGTVVLSSTGGQLAFLTCVPLSNGRDTLFPERMSWNSGMNIQQAIESPRWATRSFPASPFPHTMYRGDLWIEGGFRTRSVMSYCNAATKWRCAAPGR
jgi:hypothetical protein